MKSENKRLRLVLGVIIALQLVVLMVWMTYSWIESAAEPSVEGYDMSVTHSPGLMMYLDGTQKDVMNINDFIGDTGNRLTFMEASSANGVKLFIRDTNRYVTDPADPDKEYICFKNAVSTDENVSFVKFTIRLKADGADRKIWLKTSMDDSGLPMSYILDKNGNPLKAIRVSLTSESELNPANSFTKIFGTTADSGDMTLPGATVAIESLNSDGTGNEAGQTVSTFAQYNSEATPLYNLVQDEQIDITVMVWLEGGDSECLDDIAAGKTFDMRLHFETTLD